MLSESANDNHKKSLLITNNQWYHLSMQEKLKEFITDYYKVGMSILDLLLLASMKFNPELEWSHFTYFSLVSRILFPFIAFIFGNKGIWVFYFFTAIVKTLDITFDDFTALSCTCILFLFVPKKYRWLQVTTIVSYVISIFAVATLHEKNPYHLFAHFIGCMMLYLTVYKLRYQNDTKFRKHEEPELTFDEKIILQELLQGKQQKEIEQFSPNTVTTKLKQARERNGVKTTDDLIELFLHSISN